MSQSKIYVGNLSYDTNENGLQSRFGQYGEITEVKLIKDRETGRSKGFAFITFTQDNAAQQALSQNGVELDGRRVKVNIARDEDRSGGGGHSHGGGGHRRRQ